MKPLQEKEFWLIKGGNLSPSNSLFNNLWMDQNLWITVWPRGLIFIIRTNKQMVFVKTTGFLFTKIPWVMTQYPRIHSWVLPNHFPFTYPKNFNISQIIPTVPPSIPIIRLLSSISSGFFPPKVSQIHGILRFFPAMDGPMVQWSNGPMVQWSNGPMVQWSNGPMVQWSNGPMVQCSQVTYGCMLDACVKCGHLEKAPILWKSTGFSSTPMGKRRFVRFQSVSWDFKWDFIVFSGILTGIS